MIFQKVAELLQSYEAIDISSDLLESPQDRTMGDVALPCFGFARELKKAPQQIAADIADTLQPNDYIAKIVATGPYVNFFVNPSWLGEQVISSINESRDSYGKGAHKNEMLVIESPGPNTNKPLHLGHVRNMLLGNSLATIAEFAGYDVKKVDIINDRGVHICKSMLAYQLWGNKAEPDKKSDHYVGDWYVRYDQELQQDASLEEQIQTMLQDRESNDPATRELREKMRKRALDGMQITYKRYGTHIDRAYYESDHYLKGKDIVEEGMTKGLFTANSKGNIVFEDASMGEKTVLRSDGTSIYMTQDIALGKLRYDDRNMDRMVYVVGNEQEQHFQFLFKIFEALGYPFAEKCFHMSYGMISLPDGKMKSREGNVVDADNLADDMHQASKTLLQERYPDLNDQELETRAEIIAMAAIKFFILKYDAKKDFVFDRNQSLSFDGESGPYIQYTVARCNSILSKMPHIDTLDYALLQEDEERILLVLLQEFNHIVERSAQQYQPYLVARYILELARTFNSYYQQHKVITEDTNLSAIRCALVAGVKQVLENGLSLLGIEAPNQM